MTGQELQKLLDRAGMSQRGMAKELNINERTMRAYIAEKLKVPRTVEIAARCLCKHKPD